MALPFNLGPGPLSPQGGGLLGQAQPPPRVPWGQNPMVTMAGFSLLGGRNINEGFRNLAANAPAGMAAKVGMQRDMISQQEKSDQRLAMNAGLKLLSKMPLTPEEQAAIDRNPEVAFKIRELNQPPAPTDDMREFSEAQKNPAFGDWMLKQKQAGATNVTVGMGDNAADGRLRGKLSDAEGERWSVIQKSGNIAASRAQDFAVMEELLKIAPQGPVTGRLATMFPGFSSAGDAVNAFVYRLAPTFRVEGSGATSDLEYNGMLASLPSLSKNPLGNQIILETMKAKAAVDMERAAVVTAYQNEEISAVDARKAMMELDRKSILTPRAKALINTAGGAAPGAASSPVPPGIPQEEWDAMTPEERALFD